MKKNAAEKEQILQHLVSPAAVHAQAKVSLDELIHMSEHRLKAQDSDQSDIKETTFSEASGSNTSNTATRVLNDPKLEKKVTFARLLNKVSAEMSSGSEDMGHVRYFIIYLSMHPSKKFMLRCFRIIWFEGSASVVTHVVLCTSFQKYDVLAREAPILLIVI